MPLSPQDQAKQAAAKAAIAYIEPGSIVGVGTGSTTNFFIQELGKIKEDQVIDYAKRRGISTEAANKWLSPNISPS